MSGGTWDGTGALFLARLINKLYIRDRICKTEIWCPLDSIYDGLPWSDTGAMQADTPWSGHYTVWPAIWAVAHTTQFAQPGWMYLDGGCGRIDPKTWKGTYVSLSNPRTGDWSMIVCTDGPVTLSVSASDGLKTGPVRLWHSDAKEQFVRLENIGPAQGAITVKLDGNSIYSLTTATGQRKGAPAHPIPPARPFPFPYRDDFESYRAGQTPRYFSDQKGTFEVCDEPGHGKCLKQIVPREGIMWQYMRSVAKPYTVLGDQRWKDYTLSADVRIAGGDVELGGRFGDQNRLSYRWILAKQGDWKLNYQNRTLASGTLPGFDGSAWHSLKLVLRGTTIRGTIDGHLLAEVRDSSRANGMPYLASTYDANLFDNLAIEP
jgi:galactosylceramidase